MRPDLRFLWERPVLGAALVAVLQTSALHLLLGFLLHRGSFDWFGWIVYGVGFFICNIVGLTRERRRRRRSEASQQSP